MRVTLVITLLLAASSPAQEPSSTPPTPAAEAEAAGGGPASEEEGQRRLATPSIPEPDPGPRRVTAGVGVATADVERGRPSDPWIGARAVSTKADEAVLRFQGADQTIRPGDTIAGALVREVDTGVVVLEQDGGPEQPGGVATIVIRFDSSGRARVRTIYETDPTRVEPPGAKR